VAALCIAIATWLFPDMQAAWQYGLFAALSLGSLAIWKRYYKQNETHSRIGQAQGEEIGRTGTVSKACGPNQLGKIQFAQGLMGSREWTAVSDEVIEINTTASVVAVEGNALRIQKTAI
jgi:inner membrane protein